MNDVRAMAAAVHLTLLSAWILSFASATPPLAAQALPPKPDMTVVQVVRDFGGELFSINSVPYLEPLVNLLNATANARTFHSAEVFKDNTFTVKIGVHGMGAFVRADQRTYTPQIPRVSILDAVGGALSSGAITGNVLTGQIVIRDTAKLAGFALRALMDEGLRDGNVVIPESAPTFFGSIRPTIQIPKEYFNRRLQQGLGGLQLSPAALRSLQDAISRLPNEVALPPGQNMMLLPLSVPQVELGTLFGTELLMRYIPALNWGNNIGQFGFWGLGLKHSLSQYLTNAPFELAAQGLIQSTSLTNTIGVTGARLEANATTYSLNLHASKRWGFFEVFGGLSYDRFDIRADYTFTLPFELQVQLNLLRPVDRNGTIEYIADPANGYPGDTQPQTRGASLSAQNLRWTAGVSVYVGSLSIFADFNQSSFTNVASSMITAGVEVKF